VKQKDKVGRPDIDAFEAMMMREDCERGFFVSFDYSADALQEIESFFKRSHKAESTVDGLIKLCQRAVKTGQLRANENQPL
jgi:hypothetical protein